MSELRGSPSEAQWFAVYTSSHCERSVCRHLAERRVESFVPLYRTRRQWKKRAPETVELPLFPNYVFVRIGRAERTTVLCTPGVFAIVGSGQQSWELPALEIEALRNGISQREIEPYRYLAVGERARVTSGILQGLEGVIVRKKNSLQIVLTLDHIMQSVAIEVSAAELEPTTKSQQHHFNTHS
jgi:transcription antitermination factor NusG